MGKIATVKRPLLCHGPDNRWERVVKAWRRHGKRRGRKGTRPGGDDAENYKNGVTDEFTVPAVVTENAAIRKRGQRDLFNFRPDRARERPARWWTPILPGSGAKRASSRWCISA